MYLKRLTLHGFKSFAQKTEIHYHPGITAIVGPNGCGKSNVIDAVRWVLGEQRARALRSEKMDNVIFNGTTKRRALGLAEVSLHIENNRGILPLEYSEVVITRRLYRSGESEYLLNNVLCRLKDITDLFMDTGMGAGAYSVIELKMIEEILSESVTERRRLFEEAAGITKYKTRRKQALQKLESTQQDLARVQDLVDELERQVRSLANQAGKARKYKQFRDRFTELETQLALREFGRLQTEIAQFAARKLDVEHTLEALQGELITFEAQVEQHRLYLTHLETSLADLQQERAAHLDVIRKAEADLRVEKERHTQAQRALSRLKHEVVEADVRHGQLVKHVDSLSIALGTALETSLEQARERVEAQKKQQDAQAGYEQALQELEGLRSAERKVTQERSFLQAELGRLTNKLELMEGEVARLEQDRQAYQQSQISLFEKTQWVAESLEEAQKATERAHMLLAEGEKLHELKTVALNDAQQMLRITEQKASALGAEVKLLENLVASYEEFSQAVQFLAKKTDWSASPPLTVSDILACDVAYQVAIDAALREFAGCFVVSSEAEAGAAIDLLRSQGKGRSDFLLLNRLPKEVVTSPTVDGALPAVSVIRAAPVYYTLAQVLLGNVFLVESLEQAQALALKTDEEGPYLRFMAPTGEWADTNGTLHGGSKKHAPATANRLGRRERLAQAHEELQVLEQQKQVQTGQFRQIRDELARINLPFLRLGLQKAERQQTEVEKASERAQFEHLASAKRAQELTARVELLRVESAEIRNKHTEKEALVRVFQVQTGETEVQRQAAELVFKTAEAQQRMAAQTLNETNIRAIQAENHAQNLKNELRRKQEEAEMLRRRTQNRQDEIGQVQKNKDAAIILQEQLEANLAIWYTQKTQQDEVIHEAELNVVQSRGAIAADEAQIREVRRKRDDFQREESRIEVQLAERNTRLDALIQRTLDELGLELPPSEGATGEIPVVNDEIDEVSAKKEVAELRQKIRSLGAVNELALEDYEREKERLSFIEGQQKDLKSAEDTLLETIQEINQTATRRFNETFAEINRHFQSLFEGLFNPGDTAQLLLDDADPLEAGIKIVAKPRGKQPSGISQLSGGEKTLTAIALLFAIYLVKPSPFCILDEVDAPLDDANIERFMRLIRQFSDTTQFILVTHNKLTMEAADRMYGITMQEMGISKVVRVSFEAQEENTGAIG